MKKLFLLFGVIFFILFISLISATEINSSEYSGYFTSGIISGNISSANYQGDTASFYQQAISLINDTFYYGEITFTFSTEKISEEVTTQPPTGGVTTGGGGSTGIKKFEIGPEEISMKLKQGETKRSTLTIKNTGKSELKISIEESKLTEIIKISKSSFSLNSGETETIILDFLASEDVLPGLYIGKIIIKDRGIQKEIIAVINIESKTSLFDVEVKIPPKYEQVIPGEEIFLEIKVYNLGNTGKVDAEIEYLIKDEQNKLITSAKDIFAIETQASLTKTIHIPENIPEGRYLIYVGVTYNGKVGSSSSFFEVKKLDVSSREKIYIVIIIILIVIINIFIYYKKIRKKEKEIRQKIQLKSIIKK